MCLAQRRVFCSEPEFEGDIDLPGFKLLELDENEELWGRKVELEEKVCRIPVFTSFRSVIDSILVARPVATEARYVELGRAE
jgi:hypothetical protein